MKTDPTIQEIRAKLELNPTPNRLAEALRAVLDLLEHPRMTLHVARSDIDDGRPASTQIIRDDIARLEVSTTTEVLGGSILRLCALVDALFAREPVRGELLEQEAPTMEYAATARPEVDHRAKAFPLIAPDGDGWRLDPEATILAQRLEQITDGPDRRGLLIWSREKPARSASSGLPEVHQKLADILREASTRSFVGDAGVLAIDALVRRVKELVDPPALDDKELAEMWEEWEAAQQTGEPASVDVGKLLHEVRRARTGGGSPPVALLAAVDELLDRPDAFPVGALAPLRNARIAYPDTLEERGAALVLRWLKGPGSADRLAWVEGLVTDLHQIAREHGMSGKPSYYDDALDELLRFVSASLSSRADIPTPPPGRPIED